MTSAPERLCSGCRPQPLLDGGHCVCTGRRGREPTVKRTVGASPGPENRGVQGQRQARVPLPHGPPITTTLTALFPCWGSCPLGLGSTQLTSCPHPAPGQTPSRSEKNLQPRGARQLTGPWALPWTEAAAPSCPRGKSPLPCQNLVYTALCWEALPDPLGPISGARLLQGRGSREFPHTCVRARAPGCK